VRIEVSIEIEDSAALIALAREEYARSVTAIDCDGMSEQEALAVADLTAEEQRAHPRLITPRQAIADGADAALHIIDRALLQAGAQVDEACTEILAGEDRFPRDRPAPRGARRPGAGRSLREGRTLRKRRRSR
jgi:hypothetical protein